MGSPKNIAIHNEGKIEIHHPKRNLRRALDRIQNDKNICSENKKMIIDFINDCMIGKTVLKKSKKKIGPATCLKYLNALPKLCRAFGKSFNHVTQSDMETFISDLEYDRLISNKGIPYSEETKVGIKKAIKKFWKWKDGNNKKYPELVEWIDTYIEVKDVPALTRAEIEKIIENAIGQRNKALLMILFDSGARIEELLNVRLKKEHLFWKEEIGCYMIHLEFSKTKRRTISIPLCTDVINKWLEVHPAKKNPQAQLFPITYGSVRMFINRIGNRVLIKRITAHLLRHSSVTFYANKLNRYQLCYRYGWAMSSNMVDRYLDREGILEENTAITVKNDEISKANKESLVLKEELSLIKESNSELAKKFEDIRQELEAIKSGKQFMALLFALVKQQQKISKVLEKISGEKFDVVLPSKFAEDRLTCSNV